MADYTKVNMRAYDLLAQEYKTRIYQYAPTEISPTMFVGIPLGFAKRRFRSINALEVGPGAGKQVQYLAEHGCSTTALDISNEILKVVKGTSPSTKLIRSDVLKTRLPRNSYHLIFCAATLHLFKKKDAGKILRKFMYCLKPRGILFLTTTINKASGEGYYVKTDYPGRIKRYRHRYTKLEFTNLIRSAGFEIAKQFDWDQKHYSKKWMCFVCEKPMT